MGNDQGTAEDERSLRGLSYFLLPVSKQTDSNDGRRKHLPSARKGPWLSVLKDGTLNSYSWDVSDHPDLAL